MNLENAHTSPSHADDGTERVVRVGSEPSNDIVIDVPMVHPFHVKITLVADGCLVEDLTQTEGSGSQTFLTRLGNPDERIRITEPRWASYDDTVYLGNYPFPLVPLLKKETEPGIINDSVTPEQEENHPPRVINVGSAPSNRIVINSSVVAPRHAEFTLEADGSIIIRSCDDQATVELDKAGESSQPQSISGGGQRSGSYDDTVHLGNYPFPLSRLRDIGIKDFNLNPGKLTLIGRASDTGISQDVKDRFLTNLAKKLLRFWRNLLQKKPIKKVESNSCNLDDIRVSNRHAQFVRKGEELFIEDLGSTSGTFLNDGRLSPWTPRIVKPADIENGILGDTIKIGSYELSIDPLSKDRVRVNSVGDIRLDVDDITEKVIVRNVSFSVYPGELVGIMGPSGHGKSLLLESISGRRQITGGKTYMNNKPLPEYLEQFRRRIGYVPQMEALPPQPKVKDLLGYAAKLWLPPDLSKKEIDNQVNTILAQFNLDNVKENRIGKLSGGERRRVNIACELIRTPNLLFFDEPTTGLSSSDASNVMGILRKLTKTEKTKAGRTVIAVIHRPSMDVYNMLDRVVILFMGRLIYYGPSQLSVDYFELGETHPEGIFHVLGEYEAQIKAEPERTEELLEGWEKKFRESRDYKDYVEGRLNNLREVVGRPKLERD